MLFILLIITQFHRLFVLPSLVSIITNTEFDASVFKSFAVEVVSNASWSNTQKKASQQNLHVKLTTSSYRLMQDTTLRYALPPIGHSIFLHSRTRGHSCTAECAVCNFLPDSPSPPETSNTLTSRAVIHKWKVFTSFNKLLIVTSVRSRSTTVRRRCRCGCMMGELWAELEPSENWAATCLVPPLLPLILKRCWKLHASYRRHHQKIGAVQPFSTRGRVHWQLEK